MNLSECQAGRKLSQWCAAISRYQIRHQCDMTISLYDDKEDETPSCSHRMQGDVRVCLWKLLVTVGLCAAFCSLLHGICSLFGRNH